MNGNIAFIKEASEGSLTPSAMGGYRKKVPSVNQEAIFTRYRRGWSLILDF